jgi:hypothetical protein
LVEIRDRQIFAENGQEQPHCSPIVRLLAGTLRRRDFPEIIVKELGQGEPAGQRSAKPPKLRCQSFRGFLGLPPVGMTEGLSNLLAVISKLEKQLSGRWVRENSHPVHARLARQIRPRLLRVGHRPS